MRSLLRPQFLSLLLFSFLPAGVLGADVLSTTGFSQCVNNPSVKVEKLNVSYNKNTRSLVFDVAGESTEQQKVKGTLTVSAYGKTVYTKSFNPCNDYSEVMDMCPIPEGTFASSGSQQIPEEYASKIPSIAFSVPDLDGNVKLELQNVDTGENVGCVESTVGNGHTLQMPAISIVAAGIAAAALIFSAISAIAAGGHPGAATSSPTFGEVVGWFQGIATNGMLSVPYPQVYQSFTTNFAFSTGLVSWGTMQTAIDNFRAKTGGNLTDDNYQYLLKNATLVYDDGSDNETTTTSSRLARRALQSTVLYLRGEITDVNGTSTTIGSGGSTGSTSGQSSKSSHFVSGIESYVEQLTIPQANTFMTVLLIFAIVVAAIIVLILLFKVILEGWSMVGKLPKWLESWRKRYWWRMAKAITNLILLLYGTWTLYCIYQFTNGDSWAAKLLAALTLAAFTALLAWFTWKIYSMAQKFKRMEGGTDRLYEDKETWIKYSLFYDNYKKNYWLFFVPAIIYMFAKGCVIAGANGHGLIQAGGQLIIEAIFLVLLLWMRPHQRRSGRWINIFIQVVRMLSVVCVLVFVEELGISQTTKTITGVVLIVVQASLTVILALLIGINAIITLIRENPHNRKRKEAAAINRDLDNLTPLDARNSLLMEPMSQNTEYKPGLVHSSTFSSDTKGRYDAVPPRPESPYGRPGRLEQQDYDREYLVSSAASMGRRDQSISRSPPRQPRLPDLDFDFDNTHAR